MDRPGVEALADGLTAEAHVLAACCSSGDTPVRGVGIRNRGAGPVDAVRPRS